MTTACSRMHRCGLLLAALALVLLVSGTAAACPTCKDALAANDPGHKAMVAGYFYSILFMMSMPFLIVTTFGGYMWLEVRKARARSRDSQ